MNHPVVLRVNGQAPTESPDFHYKTPLISKVTPTFGGGELLILGEEFAYEIMTITVFDITNNRVTPCPFVIRHSYTQARCFFSDIGIAGSCLNKYVSVTIKGLTSNTLRICYKARGEVNIPIAQQIVDPDQDEDKTSHE